MDMEHRLSHTIQKFCTTLAPHFVAISCKTATGVSALETSRPDSKSKSLLLEDDRLKGTSSPSNGIPTYQTP